MKGFRKIAASFALAGALLMTGMGATPASAQSVTFTSGFQVQNLAATGATITIEFYPEGANSPSATVPDTIPASGQKTYAPLPSAVAAGFKGSAVISSDQRIAAIVNLISPSFAQQNLGSSYVGVTSGSRDVSLPLMFKNSFGFSTFTSVQNVGDQTTTVTITYRGGGLANPVEETAQIAKGAAKRFDQGANADLPNNWAGSATITSTASDIAAVVTQVGTNTSLTYNGFASGSTRPIFPLVNVNNSGFITGIALQNPTNSPTNVTVSYTPSLAGTACTETQTIAANATAYFALTNFNTAGQDCATKNTGAFVGSAQVTANSGNVELAGIVNQLNSTTNKGGAYGAFDVSTATNTVVYPLIQDRFFSYFTGVSLVNVSDVTTTITCTFSNTSVTQTSDPIVSGGSYTPLQLGEIAPGYNGSGTCTANANGARIVGIANQLILAGTTDNFFVYEGTNSSN